MSIINYLQTKPFKEIERYKVSIPDNAIAFSGVPRKHPYDTEKCLLFSNPLSDSTNIYEFSLKDILAAEDLAALINEKGESFPMIRLWLKKGSFGMKYDLFEIDNPLKYMSESEALRKKMEESFRDL